MKKPSNFNRLKRKFKNEKLDKKRRFKSEERKVIILYLHKKRPDEVLKYIERDVTRSIYYYPEQFFKIDHYDLMKLGWQTRYNLWKRLLHPPKQSSWELFATQLYLSLVDNECYRFKRNPLDAPLGYRLLRCEHRNAYISFLKKINK
ncbi:MAG: hypothetical protein JAZ19_08710 [Candidatus Thiodiazotropha taylori]|nr:hypothetical protein [Candidatus Thiodiazotropha taylori]